jgi:hypothetical protein
MVPNNEWVKAYNRGSAAEAGPPVWPVGTVLRTKHGADGGIQDHGAMSWDDTDTEVHRKAKPGELGYVIRVDSDNEDMHFIYFHPSEVSVFMTPGEIALECDLVEAGNGQEPDINGLPEGERDPYVLEQIEKAGEGESRRPNM